MKIVKKSKQSIKLGFGGTWCKNGRMEARNKKKVNLEFHATFSRKVVAMKKHVVPTMVRPTISKVKRNYINKFIGLMKESAATKVTSFQPRNC